MTFSIGDSHLSSSGFDSREEQTCLGKIKDWVFDPAIPSVAHALGGLTRSIKGVVQPFFEIADNVHAGIGGTQFTAAFLMPFGLWDLACSIAGMIKEKTAEGKFDNFLNVLGGLSEGADGIANITEGLASVGSVAPEAVMWAGPLGMAAAGASAIFIAIHAKAIHSNRCVLKAIKKAKDSNTKQLDVDALIAKLNKERHAYRLESAAGVDVKRVIAKINEVKDEVDASVKVKEIYKGLKTRIKEKQACHSLGIVITVIGIVASAILFATVLTPWAIAGFALLGGLYILVMAKMGTGAYSDHKFNKLLASPA